MSSFKITTTGTQDPVSFPDLGTRSFAHPTTVDLVNTEGLSMDECMGSQDIKDAVSAGWVTIEEQLFLGSSHITSGEVAITSIGSWETIDGTVTAPQKFSNDLSKLMGKVIGQYKTDGAGAKLRMTEDNEGVEAVMIDEDIPDTSGVWTCFGFDTAVPPTIPTAGLNCYELFGQTAAGVAFSLRYVSQSMNIKKGS